MSPEPYLARVVDGALQQLTLPVILLEGAKAVGKTTTLRRLSHTVHRLDRQVELDLVRADEDRLVHGRQPILIDEYQRYPHSIDVVRRFVDDHPGPRQFYLAGSASGAGDTHSGAGRIVSLRMRPLAFSERQVEVPTVALSSLLEGGAEVGGETTIGLSEYVDEILRSGFPNARTYSGSDLTAALRGYVDRVVERDIPDEFGRAVRRPEMLRRWIRAYAAVTGTPATLERIRDAAHRVDGQNPSQTTVLAYRDALAQLWMSDDLPAWIPSQNDLGVLLQRPKRYLADPALSAVLVGARRENLLSGEEVDCAVPRNGTFLGALFEALVVLSVTVYAQASGAHVGHFRERHGRREIDLIVERPDGGVVAIEVKLTQTVSTADVRHLHWLRERLGSKLIDAVVVGTSPYAYRRNDGIAVVPLALLGP